MYFVYDAEYHCRKHAEERFGKEAIELAIAFSHMYDEHSIVKDRTLYNQYPKDTEGNIVHVLEHMPLSNIEIYCSECIYERIAKMNK